MKQGLKIFSSILLLLQSGCYVHGNILSNKSLVASVTGRQFSFQDGVTSGNTVGFASTIDSSGNVYVTGYTDTAIDGQTQHGNDDVFISKYNSAGVLQWTVQDGVTGGTVEGISIQSDTSGNIYVMGYTDSALDGQSMTGFGDLFVSKYSSAGVRQWTVLDGGWTNIAYISPQSMAIDTSGNIFVVGTSPTTMDGQTLHGFDDLFIVKFNSSGVHQWTVQDGASAGFLSANDVATDTAGNVYVVGGTNVAIDGQTKHAAEDLFVTKYNSAGTWQWTVEDGPTSSGSSALGIALDSSSNVYVTGDTNGPLDGQTLHGISDLFISKYDSSGSRQWTIQDGVAAGGITPHRMTLDSSANLYITGSTNAGFDGQTQSGTNDLFITKYNSSGILQWTVQDGAASGLTYGEGISLGLSGDVYVCGYTKQAIDGNTQHGTEDLFVTRYTSAGAYKP